MKQIETPRDHPLAGKATELVDNERFKPLKGDYAPEEKVNNVLSSMRTVLAVELAMEPNIKKAARENVLSLNQARSRKRKPTLLRKGGAAAADLEPVILI